MNLNHSQDAIAEYRDQIARCAQALALAQNESVGLQLVGRNAAEALKMFTDGNLDKRFLKLQDHFTDLAAQFDGFDELLARYVRCVPLAAYDSGSSDGQRFLDWLCGTRRLTDVQRDYVACQRSRHAIEQLAEANRLAHVRFQEIWSARENFAQELETNRRLWLHLNPIRAWGVFRTRALLDDEADLPSTVLFFAVNSDIRTAVIEHDAEILIRELEARGPDHLDELATGPLEGTRSEMIEICLDLAEAGLLAFG